MIMKGVTALLDCRLQIVCEGPIQILWSEPYISFSEMSGDETEWSEDRHSPKTYIHQDISLLKRWRDVSFKRGDVKK